MNSACVIGAIPPAETDCATASNCERLRSCKLRTAEMGSLSAAAPVEMAVSEAYARVAVLLQLDAAVCALVWPVPARLITKMEARSVGAREFMAPSVGLKRTNKASPLKWTPIKYLLPACSGSQS